MVPAANAPTPTQMAQLARGKPRDKIPALALALERQPEGAHRFLLPTTASVRLSPRL